MPNTTRTSAASVKLLPGVVADRGCAAVLIGAFRLEDRSAGVRGCFQVGWWVTSPTSDDLRCAIVEQGAPSSRESQLALVGSTAGEAHSAATGRELEALCHREACAETVG